MSSGRCPGWGWLFDLDVKDRIKAMSQADSRRKLRESLEAATGGLGVDHALVVGSVSGQRDR